MKIFITGSSGFIGFHLSKSLLQNNHVVLGFDSMNNYYDVKLKQSRLKILKKEENFLFKKINIENGKKIKNLFKNFKPNYVIHLAAQAGVRYSIDNPHAYVDSNLVGFVNILEGCRQNKIKHLQQETQNQSSSRTISKSKRDPTTTISKLLWIQREKMTLPTKLLRRGPKPIRYVRL